MKCECPAEGACPFHTHEKEFVGCEIDKEERLLLGAHACLIDIDCPVYAKRFIKIALEEINSGGKQTDAEFINKVLKIKDPFVFIAFVAENVEDWSDTYYSKFIVASVEVANKIYNRKTKI